MHLKTTLPRNFVIPRLYDSHTHFQATGEWSLGLNLNFMTCPHDVLKVVPAPAQFRGEWLFGFGWNELSWSTQEGFNLQLLDQAFPDFPVLFTRVDGHSSWVNSKAIEKLNIQSNSGLLSETEHLRAYGNIPGYSHEQVRHQLIAACKQFNRSGFTHIRDMTCTEELWNTLVELENEKLLTVAVEENFTIYDLKDFDQALKSCLYTRKNETALLRSKGIKIFYDGTLGSQTALLSQPYCGDPQQGSGKSLWSLADVEEVLRKAWSEKLEVSVHTIGDEAAHQIVSCARQLSAKGAVGRLNLEHAQVMRPETIQMMKPLHVKCYMQPCHWLSDKKWLKERLGVLYPHAFPWEALRAAQVPIYFGCDSPIEPTSFFSNVKALEESPSESIKKLKGEISQFHSHPDKTFADSYTVVQNDQIAEVVFCGNSLSI